MKVKKFKITIEFTDIVVAATEEAAEAKFIKDLATDHDIGEYLVIEEIPMAGHDFNKTW